MISQSLPWLDQIGVLPGAAITPQAHQSEPSRRGRGHVKKLGLFIGCWQVIWKMADSCLMIISSIFKKRRLTPDDVRRLFSCISCEIEGKQEGTVLFIFFLLRSALKFKDLFSITLFICAREVS